MYQSFLLEKKDEGGTEGGKEERGVVCCKSILILKSLLHVWKCLQNPCASIFLLIKIILFSHLQVKWTFQEYARFCSMASHTFWHPDSSYLFLLLWKTCIQVYKYICTFLLERGSIRISRKSFLENKWKRIKTYMVRA